MVYNFILLLFDLARCSVNSVSLDFFVPRFILIMEPPLSIFNSQFYPYPGTTEDLKLRLAVVSDSRSI